MLLVRPCLADLKRELFLSFLEYETSNYIKRGYYYASDNLLVAHN